MVYNFANAAFQGIRKALWNDADSLGLYMTVDGWVYVPSVGLREGFRVKPLNVAQTTALTGVGRVTGTLRKAAACSLNLVHELPQFNEKFTSLAGDYTYYEVPFWVVSIVFGDPVLYKRSDGLAFIYQDEGPCTFVKRPNGVALPPFSTVAP